MPGFAHDQAHQRVHLRFEQVGGAGEAVGALADGRRLPDRRGGNGVRDRRAHLLRRCLDHRADHVAQIGRIAHVARRAVAGKLAARRFEHRRRAPRIVRAREQRRRQRRQPMLVRQVEAHRIEAFVAVQLARQRDLRVRRAERRELATLRRSGSCTSSLTGIDVIGDAIHERRVRAVLEQAAHEIREQRLVRADRRIHATRPVQLVAAR